MTRVNCLKGGHCHVFMLLMVSCWSYTFHFSLVNLVVGVPHLREVFYRMGLSDKDIVALSGGHTLVNPSFYFHGFLAINKGTL